MVKEGRLNSEDVLTYFLDLKEGIFRRRRRFTGENIVGWLEMELDPRKENEFTGKLVYRMGEEDTEY